MNTQPPASPGAEPAEITGHNAADPGPDARRRATEDGDRSPAGSTYGDWAPEGGSHSPIDPRRRGGSAAAGADADAPGEDDAPDLDPDDPDFELARARIAERRGLQRRRAQASDASDAGGASPVEGHDAHPTPSPARPTPDPDVPGANARSNAALPTRRA